MLDFLGTIAIAATLAVCLFAFISAMAVPAAVRLVLAIVVGAWIGLALAFGVIGEFADAGRRPVPLVGIMFATPLIAAALVAWLWPEGRRALLSVPMPLLIGLNIPRLLGGMFLLLAAEGRLGGPFPASAAWGDMITAVVAIPLVWLAARAGTGSTWLIGAWDIFGALDLLAAVGLATLSTPGSPLQVIPTDIGPGAMQQLPWALIPTVLVPYWLIAHAIILAQLRSRATPHP